MYTHKYSRYFNGYKWAVCGLTIPTRISEEECERLHIPLKDRIQLKRTSTLSRKYFSSEWKDVTCPRCLALRGR